MNITQAEYELKLCSLALDQAFDDYEESPTAETHKALEYAQLEYRKALKYHDVSNGIVDEYYHI